MRAGSRRCPQRRSFSVQQKMESECDRSSFQLGSRVEPSSLWRRGLLEPQRCRLLSGRLHFCKSPHPVLRARPWSSMCGPDLAWPLFALISWDHVPDKISHLLHFRGGLWCPVTFATVCCCSFETAKNGELCQTTQNFKPHQLQLGRPEEGCLYLSLLSSPAWQLTGADENH
ncbi:hypothetical protein NN561_012088 [Cricetulus griseus]